MLKEFQWACDRRTDIRTSCVTGNKKWDVFRDTEYTHHTRCIHYSAQKYI